MDRPRPESGGEGRIFPLFLKWKFVSIAQTPCPLHQNDSRQIPFSRYSQVSQKMATPSPETLWPYRTHNLFTGTHHHTFLPVLGVNLFNLAGTDFKFRYLAPRVEGIDGEDICPGLKEMERNKGNARFCLLRNLRFYSDTPPP